MKRILTGIITTYPLSRERLMKKLLERFRDITSPQIYCGVLWILGEYSHGNTVTETLEEIIDAIGPIPITLSSITPEENKIEEKEVIKSFTKKYKTVILADGSYGTELIEEKDS